jgi:four helix bundle protein
MLLVEEVYLITHKLPKSEIFGLVSQMQRASVAIPSNIAEGSKRGHKEYIQFLNIAHGSAAELETQLLLTSKLYEGLEINFQKAVGLLNEVMKMLYALITKLKAL